jgi:hypothetical protein
VQLLHHHVSPALLVFSVPLALRFQLNSVLQARIVQEMVSDQSFVTQVLQITFQVQLNALNVSLVLGLPTLDQLYVQIALQDRIQQLLVQ